MSDVTGQQVFSRAELCALTLMDRLIVSNAPSESHCLCNSKLPMHSRVGECECFMSLPVCDCSKSIRKPLLDIGLWCVQTSPSTGRLYAGLSHIMRKKKVNKTVVVLPDECLSVCGIYGSKRGVGTIQLCLIALHLNRNTPSAYSLLSEILLDQDAERGVIKLPDGREMNPTELSNESLRVIEDISGGGISALTRRPPLHTVPGGEEESKRDVRNIAQTSALLTDIDEQVNMLKNDLAQIVIVDPYNWLPLSFLNSILEVFSSQGARELSSLNVDVSSALAEVQNLLLSKQPDPSKLIESLNYCEFELKQSNQQVSQGVELTYGQKKHRSRLLLLMALIYLQMDTPISNDKIPTIASETSSLTPIEAAETLNVIRPDYINDAKNTLHIYLEGLSTKETTYDLLYLLILSVILRLEKKVGSYSPMCVPMPFACAYKLLVTVITLSRAKYKDPVTGWEEFAMDEFKFYKCIDTTAFNTGISEESAEQGEQHYRSIRRRRVIADEWEDLKVENPDLSSTVPTMDALMRLTGLEEVKDSVLKLYKRVSVARKRGSKGTDIPLNFRFVGNPGAGKTVTARLLAQILAELGLRIGKDSRADQAHQVAVDDANQARLNYETDRVLVLQESLREQQCILAASSAQERVDALSESLTSVRSVINIAQNIQGHVDVSYEQYVSNAVRTNADLERNLEQRYNTATADLNRAIQDRNNQAQALANQRANAATSQSTFNSAAAAAQSSAPIERFIDIAGGELAIKGRNYFASMVDPLLDANPPGGVIFIDEAHQLMSSSSPQGRDVIQALVKYAEDHRNTLSFILAGYANEMEKLIEADPGLASRFPSQNKFEFVDFSIPQLTDIFRTMIQAIPVPDGKPKWKLEDESLADVVGRRIGRGRGQKGFANARAVRNLLEGPVMARSDDRMEKRMRVESSIPDDELFTLTTGDVLGQEPDPANSVPFQKLMNMIGLESVKTSIGDIMRTLKHVWDSDLESQPCTFPQLNRLFVGPPGTGKTTVAELYGKILAESGFLQDGEVVKKIPSDFIGDVIGGSETKTKNILESCRGKVLLIDEAYGLARDTEFHRAVLDTIVAEVPPQGGGDMVVILVGYEDEIDDMIRKGNSGLSRRFSEKVKFDAYTADELRRIMKQRCSSQNMDMSYLISQEAANILSRERKLRNFGNAGAAINFVDKMRSAARKRLEDDVNAGRIPPQRPGASITLTMEDVHAVIEVADAFDDMIIPDELKKYIDDLENERKFASALKQLPPQLKHVAFVGPAGTGKTTAARAMAKMLKQAGVLPTSNLIELNGESVVGKYIGETADVMKSKLQQAMGGVLFIDEAHRMYSGGKLGGQYKDEALGVLIAAMTAPEYQDNILIVLAGYTAPMNLLLDSDPGLKRRVGRIVEFKNIDAATAEVVLHSKLKKKGYAMAASCHGEPIQSIFRILISRPGWGNIGDIERLCELLYSSLSSRLINASKYMEPDDAAVFLGSWNKEYTLDDLTEAGELFIKSRPKSLLNSMFPPSSGHIDSDQDEFQAAGANSRPRQNMESKMSQATATKAEDHAHDCSCSDNEDSKKSNAAPQSGNRRKILDVLNQLYLDNLTPDQYANMLLDGPNDPAWSMIKKQAVSKLNDSGIDDLENEILKTMEASQQAHRESEQRRAEMETSKRNLQRINDMLESSALSASEVAEYERLKAEEEERMRGMVELCGYCYRLNSPTSGCAYGGNSPNVVLVPVSEAQSQFAY